MKKKIIGLLLTLNLVIVMTASVFGAESGLMAKNSGGYLYYYQASLTDTKAYSYINRPASRTGSTYEARVTVECYDSRIGTYKMNLYSGEVDDGVTDVEYTAVAGCSFRHSWNYYYINGAEEKSFYIELTPNSVITRSLTGDL